MENAHQKFREFIAEKDQVTKDMLTSQMTIFKSVLNDVNKLTDEARNGSWINCKLIRKNRKFGKIKKLSALDKNGQDYLIRIIFQVKLTN